LSFKDVKSIKEKIETIFEDIKNLEVNDKPAKMPGRDHVDLEEFAVSVYSVSG